MKIEFARFFPYSHYQENGWFKIKIIRSFSLLIAILTFFTSAFTPIPQRLHETQEPSPSLLPTPPAQSNVTIRLETIAQGLTAPRGLISPPDGSGRIFVVSQTGQVNIIESGGQVLENPILNLRGQVALPRDDNSLYGLLALTFHPDFIENGRFFVYYTAPLREQAPPGWDHTVHVVEFSVSDEDQNAIDPQSERAVLIIDQPYPTMGHLEFSPDGFLQIAFGDTTKPTFCLDVDQIEVVQVECTTGGSPDLDLSDIRARLGISGSSLDLIAGQLYHGTAFPAFQDRYIFGVNGAISDQMTNQSQAGNPGDSGLRLFITSELSSGGRNLRIEQLMVSNWEMGSNIETLHGIDRDTSGELYLIASTTSEQGIQNGVIYKILPQIMSQRSLIDNPEVYLPAPFRYARLVRQAPVYRSLTDVRLNEPFGRHGGGNYWVTIRDQAQVDGRTYYSVSWGWGNTGWVSGNYINLNAHLSSLRGIDLQEWKGEPLAMVYTGVNVRSLPGILVDETIIGSLPPYSVVTVLETRRVNGAVWYRIGPDQWTHSNYLRLLIPNSRPADVGPGEKWVEVNLAEQTLIAYEGDRPVFATLTATGRRGLETEKGLFRTWAILQQGPMQWENVTPPYSLASVPWIMYFNRGQGLHGVYWHDLYGTVRSAGCVNLSPHDSHWIFQWAVPNFPEGQRVYYTTENDPGLWVWVHDNKPDLNRQIDAFQISQADWPTAARLPEAEHLVGMGFIP
ncbi:MAG: L,D-transpeptidase family protein [Anaerolineales bacterium]|nr:L,D-transpeptidase family protein [Anaerolineales bacterium]